MVKKDNMSEERKKWLKKNKPWEYDALYGDPVTGKNNSNENGCLSVIFIGIIALGIMGLITFL